LFYNRQPSAAEFATRLTRVFRNKPGSLLTLLQIRSADPHEQTCGKVAGGYGAMCPPSDCPPYNFTCGGECVTVLGVGANKVSEAKELAEQETNESCN